MIFFVVRHIISIIIINLIIIIFFVRGLSAWVLDRLEISGLGLLSRPSTASTCYVGGTLSIMMITMLSQNCFYLLHVYVVVCRGGNHISFKRVMMLQVRETPYWLVEHSLEKEARSALQWSLSSLSS